MPGTPEEEGKQTQPKQGGLEVHREERLRVRLLFEHFLEWEERAVSVDSICALCQQRPTSERTADATQITSTTIRTPNPRISRRPLAQWRHALLLDLPAPCSSIPVRLVYTPPLRRPRCTMSGAPVRSAPLARPGSEQAARGNLHRLAPSHASTVTIVYVIG